MGRAGVGVEVDGAWTELKRGWLQGFGQASTRALGGRAFGYFGTECGDAGDGTPRRGSAEQGVLVVGHLDMVVRIVGRRGVGRVIR